MDAINSYDNLKEKINSLMYEISTECFGVGIKEHILHELENISSTVDTIQQVAVQAITNQNFDSLTGLHSRLYFNKILADMELNKEGPFCLVFGDVNNLKVTNDVFGHCAGDLLLTTIASILLEEAGMNAVVSRIGGDEMTMILRNTSYEETEQICKKIQMSCRNTSTLKFPASISLGFVEVDNLSKPFSEYLAEAEAKMYSNKMIDKSKRNIFSDVQELLFHRGVLNRENLDYQEKIAAEFAAYIGMDDRQTAAVRLGIQFQDVGFLTIPLEIVNKSIKLTPQEVAIMRTHVEAGFRLVRLYEQTFSISSLVLQSHEAWNGLGYPKGLKGDEIAPEAQVMYIVSQYVKWTSSRPFGSGLKPEEGFHRLKQRSGDQFNPKLVDLLQEFLLEKGYVLPEAAENYHGKYQD